MSDQKPEKLIDNVDFDRRGLVPVIAQNLEGKILTLAYMNREALKKTLSEGAAYYYSRSKKRIRMKGEVSGNTQKVKEIKIDCDGDALLMRVEQTGPACHTGEESCFYQVLGQPKDPGGGIDYSLAIVNELYHLIEDRKKNPKEDSYTSALFEGGEEVVQRKLGEEAIELLVSSEKDDIIQEASDLVYHLLVFLAFRGADLEEVMEELRERRG